MIMIAIATVLFVAFLEFSGQLFLAKLGINHYSLGLGVGLLVLMAYCYITTSIFTALNCSFWLVLTIYLIYIVLALFLIIKNIKKIKYKFNIIDWVIVASIALILSYYSSKTALGDLNAFDTTFYLNMITGNIKLSNMNTINALYGGSGGIYHDYVFQSYYYFASVVTYIITNVFNYVFEINYTTTFIWFFQILYFFFFSSLMINSLNRVKKENYLVKIFILIIYIFFYGKLYYNNVFGFYGNTYRTIGIAYGIMVLYDLFKEHNNCNWLLLITCLVGSCAFSSTSAFEIVFIIFGSFFILIDKEDNYFKYIAFVLLLPLANLLYISLYLPVSTALFISTFVSILLFVGNDCLVKLFRKKYIKYAILFFVTMMMLLLSYKVTNNFLDFSAFNNNLSGKYDMTIDYTKIGFPWDSLNKLFCVISLFMLGFTIIFNHQDDLIRFFIILIVAIFNPFCCSYLNSINAVYYRAYEIMLNPFTLTLMCEMAFSNRKLKYSIRAIITLILVIFISKIDLKNPIFWHESFVPGEGYNELYKMSNNEYSIIKYIKEDAQYRGLSNPYIVTTNLLTQSYVPNGKYLYCREFKINDNWNNAEKKLHDIFDGELVTENLDEVDLATLIKESEIDYLVIYKKQEYYNFTEDYYSYLYLYVSECNYGYNAYENDDYAVFFFEKSIN